MINNPNLQINGFAVGLNYGGPYYESLTGNILYPSLLTKVTQHTDFDICLKPDAREMIAFFFSGPTIMPVIWQMLQQR